MQVRSSQLDPTVTVIEIETGDEGHLVEMLETRGHGFAAGRQRDVQVLEDVDGRLHDRVCATRRAPEFYSSTRRSALARRPRNANASLPSQGTSN